MLIGSLSKLHAASIPCSEEKNNKHLALKSGNLKLSAKVLLLGQGEQAQRHLTFLFSFFFFGSNVWMVAHYQL